MTQVPPSLIVHAHRGVAEFAAGLSLTQAARLLERAGYFWPLPRPLPAATLAEACRFWPTVAFGLASRVDGFARGGDALSSGPSPHAAMGPDARAAFLGPVAVADATRVWLRVFARHQVRVERIDAESIDDAAQIVATAMSAARACAVAAWRTHVRVATPLLEWAAPHVDERRGLRLPTASRHDWQAAPVGAIASFTPAEIATHLKRGGVLAGFPRAHRAGVLHTIVEHVGDVGTARQSAMAVADALAAGGTA